MPGLAPIRKEANQILCCYGHGNHCGTEGVSLRQDRLRSLTALLVPVGGFFTINATQAKKLADEVAPAVVIPMHYRGKGFGYPVIGNVNKFTKLCGDVVTYPGSELEFTPQISKQAAVLKPQNA